MIAIIFAMKIGWFVGINMVRMLQSKNPYRIPSVIMGITMLYFSTAVYLIYIAHDLHSIAIEWIFLMVMVGYLRSILSGIFRNGIVMLYMLIAEITYAVLFFIFYG